MTKDIKEAIHDYEAFNPDASARLKLIQRAQKHEAQYLPSEKTLYSIVKNFKPCHQLSTIEALIEFEYLTLICLHHRRNYYRLYIGIPDGLYDDLEARVEALRKVIPPEFIPPKHILLDNIGY
ncbi:MAG: DNA ligase [Candidatus Liberibacter europaeus]|uniref:DNA ligase n=1 Tax=Candidatus Liberibacter europaeus TaxID=744859 RepID=A0A2T4VWP7_9HYPH|nr:DNA ligase [Candidatus Liberibacter europaeus]MBY7649802.1 DNA ligase [Candidatus Liberibacter europaeus]PTL86205.1 MAG: DNA ligase [Candidatus Liberibacter europaeus]PTL86448.1 MAG: DNA ligase [Candidatus Liberibacter europaeus]